MIETARLIHTEFPDAKVLSVTLDVTDEKSVNDMVDQAVQAFGTLDCGETTSQTWRKVSLDRELTLLV